MLVDYARNRGVATLTLDSPQNRNALSAALVGELSQHLSDAAADATVRAVVITHTGSTFCAGADLREQVSEGGPHAGTARMVRLLRTIVELPKPVVAGVNGHARAGGVGVVGACDFALAGPGASFAFTEARLGLAPAIISLTTQSRMSERAAARYYLTGQSFDGATAAGIGLITSASADLDAELEALLDELRACSPQGLTETKLLTTAAVLRAFDEDADALQAQSARLFASAEAREGMQAFIEKRAPSWALPR